MVVIVFDIETVQPCSKKYQVHNARIWQIAFVCKGDEREWYLHPGFDLDNLCQKSKDFLTDEDHKTLHALDQKTTLASEWKSICSWLTSKATPTGDVVLVAQQANRGDEIVLAVEMVRYDLRWPPELEIRVVEALHSIRSVLHDYDGSWAVSAVYRELWQKEPENPHRALCDAKCLARNLLMCWAKLIGYSKEYAVAHEDSFWNSVQSVFGWHPLKPWDHRQSIWVMATVPKGIRWPRELVRAMEERADVHTIADLVIRGADPDFMPGLCADTVFRRYMRCICDGINRHLIKTT